jgi:hypothetical protein
MAVMMVATVMPAFAKKNTETPPNCEDGNNNAFYKPGGDNRDEQATNSLDKNSFGTTKKFDTYKKPHAPYCEE